MKAIERLIQYIEYKGFSNRSFEMQIRLSNGYIGTQLKRNADLGEGILNKIIENCPDLNPEWLLTGKGSMLKNDYKPQLIDNDDIIGRISYIRDAFFEGNNSKFASFMGTNEANIRNYCKSIVPRTEFLITLANKLEINFDWLMLGKGQIKRLHSNSYEDFDLNEGNYLKYLIQLQREIIENQKNEIETLKKELNISSK